MKFVDSLYSKYASPQFLIDELISNCDFFEWVIEFINAENDRQAWEVWLHKVFDKSFEDFKKSVGISQNEITEEQIETTVLDSKSLLSEFIPAK